MAVLAVRLTLWGRLWPAGLADALSVLLLQGYPDTQPPSEREEKRFASKFYLRMNDVRGNHAILMCVRFMDPLLVLTLERSERRLGARISSAQ